MDKTLAIFKGVTDFIAVKEKYPEFLEFVVTQIGILERSVESYVNAQGHHLTQLGRYEARERESRVQANLLEQRAEKAERKLVLVRVELKSLNNGHT